MSQLFRLPSSVKRDPSVDTWVQQHTGDLGEIAKHWFGVMRACGDHVREVLHDGHPTACFTDAAFAYVNAFRGHVNVGLSGQEVGTEKQHFCQPCADAYFAGTPGMNAMRNLICLSDSYRSKLYDLLEGAHPEALDNHDIEACRRGSETMRNFLREHFKKDGVEVSGDVFIMLCQDFFGSHHFYTRSDEFNRRKPTETTRGN